MKEILRLYPVNKAPSWNKGQLLWHDFNYKYTWKLKPATITRLLEKNRERV